jgi:hypothetical protein
VPATREDLVKIAREVVTGPNRPIYCENPAAFDPHEWVLEAMHRAYLRGQCDGAEQALRATVPQLYPEAG